MSFPEKCSFVPPKVYDGSLQRASSSAGEMSGEKERKTKFMKVIMGSVNTFKIDKYVAGGNAWLSYEHSKQPKTTSLTLENRNESTYQEMKLTN